MNAISARQAQAVSALQRIRRREKSDRCELCAARLGARHQHLLDPATRVLICACDGCVILFDPNGATKYKRVPRDVLIAQDIASQTGGWEKFLLPIKLAFFYKSSHARRIVAIYPSSVGVTESVLNHEDLEVHPPPITELREDIEALLVHRLEGRQEYFIAPIDRCFELVGLVRRNWSGIGGGDRVWREVAGFFAKLREDAAVRARGDASK